MHRELGYLEKTNGLVMLLIVAFVVLSTAALFRPHRPSPFTEHGGYGAGWGTDSIMFGGGPKRAAAH
jgi:hypothetical protein